jgi:hypothetical protein
MPTISCRTNKSIIPCIRVSHGILRVPERNLMPWESIMKCRVVAFHRQLVINT